MTAPVLPPRRRRWYRLADFAGWTIQDWLVVEAGAEALAGEGLHRTDAFDLAIAQQLERRRRERKGAPS